MRAKQARDEAAHPTVADSLKAERAAYEPPKILKKRSVARVTLFSGTGTSGQLVTTG